MDMDFVRGSVLTTYSLYLLNIVFMNGIWHDWNIRQRRVVASPYFVKKGFL